MVSDLLQLLGESPEDLFDGQEAFVTEIGAVLLSTLAASPPSMTVCGRARPEVERRDAPLRRVVRPGLGRAYALHSSA